MKIVVCAYKFDFFFFLSAVLHLTPTKVLIESYDKHYEIILFLDNALHSDYCLVTCYLRRLFGLSVPLSLYRQVLPRTKLLVGETCR